MEANWKIMLFAVGAHVFFFGGILNFGTKKALKYMGCYDFFHVFR